MVADDHLVHREQFARFLIGHPVDIALLRCWTAHSLFTLEDVLKSDSEGDFLALSSHITSDLSPIVVKQAQTMLDAAVLLLRELSQKAFRQSSERTSQIGEALPGHCELSVQPQSVESKYDGEHAAHAVFPLTVSFAAAEVLESVLVRVRQMESCRFALYFAQAVHPPQSAIVAADGLAASAPSTGWVRLRCDLPLPPRYVTGVELVFSPLLDMRLYALLYLTPIDPVLG